MEQLSRATDASQKFQLTTDGLAAYSYAVGSVLGHEGTRVDYAQLAKVCSTWLPKIHAATVSPPDVVEAIPTPIYGDPDGKKNLHVAY
jgi:hypothetical protein